MKHTILFLAANPLGTDMLALDEEVHAIQEELERNDAQDCLELVTRSAVRPLDLLRELRKVRPVIVHFSGHGASVGSGDHRSAPRPRRDPVGESGLHGDEPPREGLLFQGPDGRPQLVSIVALEETFGASGASVQLVVLSACYSRRAGTSAAVARRLRRGHERLHHHEHRDRAPHLADVHAGSG